jgi:antitoxin HicB
MKARNLELKLDDYAFTVRLMTEDEGGGYLIEYPDVPGCMSDGETPEEAIANGRDALKAVLLFLQEFGRPLPQPARLPRAAGNGSSAFRGRCTPA